MSEWDNERKCWVHEEEKLPPIPVVTYTEDATGGWWCDTHRRVATHVRHFNNSRSSERCCNPKLGGIMIPCVVRKGFG